MYHLFRATSQSGNSHESTDLQEVKTWRDENAPGEVIHDITIQTRTVYSVTVGNATQSWPDDLAAATAWRDANAPGAAITQSQEDYEVEPYEVVQE